ncbi:MULTISPECIES: GNAT family protein [Spirulina sp. CCY15215]|uniref:GNAT family N-acetyltransferase n=1 Tax=Spirulina sp. CCY15215 TaxID=2767591 RepID=UPI001951DFCB|nr:GNAT family protein [Spirulina major]
MIKLPDRLETKRLILRPCCLQDYSDYLEFMQDEQATQYLAFSPEQRTETGAKQLFEQEQALIQEEAFLECQGAIALVLSSKTNNLF